jgi:hypothetical protein
MQLFKQSFHSLPAEYDASVSIKADPLVKDEIVYWDVKELYLQTHTVKLFQVNFENLFNGDKELGKRFQQT